MEVNLCDDGYRRRYRLSFWDQDQSCREWPTLGVTRELSWIVRRLSHFEQRLHHLIHGRVFELALFRFPRGRTLRKGYHDIVGMFLEDG